MRHTVRHIHFVGMPARRSEQGSRLQDVSVREVRRMPAGQKSGYRVQDPGAGA